MIFELAANVFNITSVLLAGRNSVHTWWTGIVACGLFAWVFFGAKLYADVVLQVFFITTCVAGWWSWHRGREHPERPIRRTRVRSLLGLALVGVLFAGAFGAFLAATTDAAAPLADSAVLAFSVLGQLLLVGRRSETWWCWILVDTIAVPLFLSRGLHLTALLYAGFWIHAWVALWLWRRRLDVPLEHREGLAW